MPNGTMRSGDRRASSTVAKGSNTDHIAHVLLVDDTDAAVSVGGGGTAGSTSTAAAPSYAEGATAQALSTNLTGDLRTIAKQSGTWNIGSVTTLPALVAGSAIVGKVGIDQTTDGTTNLVAAKQSGTWNIGSVTTLPALVAGSAIVGKVGIDQTTDGTTNLVAAKQSGTWNVTNISGTITLPTGAAEQASLAAAAASLAAIETAAGTALERTADTLSAAIATDVLMNDVTALTPKFAAISASSSGDNTLVAAVASKKIRVLAYNLMGAGAVNARFQTAAAGAYLTGLKYVAAAGGGICAPFNPLGWFETVAGDLLNLELSGAVAVGGELVYVEV